MKRLVLSRKKTQSVHVNGPCVIKIIDIKGGTVRMVFEAEETTAILRGELVTPQDGPLEADGGPSGPPILAETVRVEHETNTEETGVFPASGEAA